MANPPPQIGGSLRDTIHSLAFGMIVSTLVVNFSKIFLDNFFVYICGVVFSIEFLLFALYRPSNADVELYREPGRRGKLRVESGSTEYEEMTSAQPSPSKKNPAGKKKDKQSKKAEKDKHHHASAGGEKKRESLVVTTNASVEATSEAEPSPSSPTSPSHEKSGTWKRKFGHKWDAYKEKREVKKAEKDKDKDEKDVESPESGSKSPEEETKKEETALDEKDVNEPKDEKIEDVALMKGDEEEEKNQDNREKEEGTENNDPFEEDFGDDDENKKEKPKMKLKWPKKRPKSTSSE